MISINHLWSVRRAVSVLIIIISAAISLPAIASSVLNDTLMIRTATEQYRTEDSVFVLFRTRDSASVRFIALWRVCEATHQSRWNEMNLVMATKEALRKAAANFDNVQDLLNEHYDLGNKLQENIEDKVRPYGVCIESIELHKTNDMHNTEGSLGSD